MLNNENQAQCWLNFLAYEESYLSENNFSIERMQEVFFHLNVNGELLAYQKALKSVCAIIHFIGKIKNKNVFKWKSTLSQLVSIFLFEIRKEIEINCEFDKAVVDFLNINFNDALLKRAVPLPFLRKVSNSSFHQRDVEQSGTEQAFFHYLSLTKKHKISPLLAKYAIYSKSSIDILAFLKEKDYLSLYCFSVIFNNYLSTLKTKSGSIPVRADFLALYYSSKLYNHYWEVVSPTKLKSYRYCFLSTKIAQGEKVFNEKEIEKLGAIFSDEEVGKENLLILSHFYSKKLEESFEQEPDGLFIRTFASGKQSNIPFLFDTLYLLLENNLGCSKNILTLQIIWIVQNICQNLSLDNLIDLTFVIKQLPLLSRIKQAFDLPIEKIIVVNLNKNISNKGKAEILSFLEKNTLFLSMLIKDLFNEMSAEQVDLLKTIETYFLAVNQDW